MAERWSSRLGFVLATVGAAVGLGNVWRFPSVVGQNGGGAYLLPYLFAAFVFAVPLVVLEFAVGRSLRTDVVSAFRTVGTRYAALGWVVAGSVLVVLSYYLVLTGWVLAFFVGAATGLPLSFASFTATYWPVVAFVVVAAAVAAVVSLGVKSGIERLSTAVMPVVFVVLAGLAVYAWTLPGWAAGVSFFLTPRLSVLSDVGVWSAAFGQVFFSLSGGQGIMLTYGAYVDDETPLWGSAALVAVADVAVACTAGLVIFPVVFTLGVEPTAGTQLAFTTLPRAFAAMPFGRVVAVGFFGLLFLAALTSAVSLLEVGVASATRATDWGRPRATIALMAGVAVLGLPSALSYSPAAVSLAGVPFLDVVDESVGTFALPVTAFLLVAAFAWVADADVVRETLGRAYPLVKYAIPVVLVAVTGTAAAGVVTPGWSLTARALLVGLVRPVPFLVTLAVLLGVGWLLRDRVRPRRWRR
ncbi:MAG: sodium-dependent transporter [Halarchaeum sp.]